MVVTFIEAHVVPDEWTALEQAYKAGTQRLPPQLSQTFLVQSAADPTLWQIISVWASLEALLEARRMTEMPTGVLMFRAAGAEPTHSVFDVVATASEASK